MTALFYYFYLPTLLLILFSVVFGVNISKQLNPHSEISAHDHEYLLSSHVNREATPWSMRTPYGH